MDGGEDWERVRGSETPATALSPFTPPSLSLSPPQLLEQPQFQTITKIKTIGSTYMAASGLIPEPSPGPGTVGPRTHRPPCNGPWM